MGWRGLLDSLGSRSLLGSRLDGGYRIAGSARGRGRCNRRCHRGREGNGPGHEGLGLRDRRDWRMVLGSAAAAYRVSPKRSDTQKNE